jgi:hypothetical protein
MNRRTFLTTLSAAFALLVARLPWAPYGAVFRVTEIDEDGSGMELSGHLGSYVYNAKRCCKNCTTIFAVFKPGGDVDNGTQFCHGELTPVNAAARLVMDEVLAKSRTMWGTAEFFQAT